MSNRLLRRDSRTPTLDLNFLAMNEATFDKRITFSRAGHATMFDSTGKLTFAPNNLVLRSEEFDNASWIKNNLTVSANAVAAPNETLTADKLAETNTVNVFHQCQQASAFSTTRHMFSFYVKAAERDTGTILLSDNGGSANFIFASFDMTAGTVGSITTAGSGWSSGTATITAIGSGWFRVSLVATFSSETVARGWIEVTNAGTRQYTGTTGSGFHVWGAQMERVTYETSPRPYNATTSAAYYGPRLEYDPVSLAAKGLLVEEARTNLRTRSEAFNLTTDWTTNEGAITTDTVTSPAGLTNADTLTANAGSGLAPRTFNFSLISLTTNADYAHSVFVKKGTHRYVFIVQQKTAENFISAVFDLDGGGTTATETDVGTTSGTIVSTHQQDVGGGWYRLTLVGRATGASGYIVVAMAPAATGNTYNNTGYPTGTYAGTETIHIWGAQVEAGSFPTSYIPTTTASATRAVDSATITGGALGWYNTRQGAFLAQFDKASTALRGGVVVAGGTAAINANGVSIDGQNNGKVRVYIETNGALELSLLTLADYTANTTIRAGVAYNTNNANGAAIGIIGALDGSVTLPPVDTLTLGAVKSGTAAVANWLNGHIARVRYFNTRLPDGELRAGSV